VFAPSQGTPMRAFAGEYVDASGDVSLGVDVGANVLFGGSNHTIALQPLSERLADPAKQCYHAEGAPANGSPSVPGEREPQLVRSIT
jgi:hypothetical protein